MSEDDLARKIIGTLDRGLADLSPDTTGKLARARRQALASPSRPAPVFMRLRNWAASHRVAFSLALPAMFILVAAGTVLYLQTINTPDPMDVEAALLAGELPIHAYTDPGFDTWLSHASHKRQQ